MTLSKVLAVKLLWPCLAYNQLQTRDKMRQCLVDKSVYKPSFVKVIDNRKDNENIFYAVLNAVNAALCK
jgi:hypothetical protein